MAKKFLVAVGLVFAGFAVGRASQPAPAHVYEMRTYTAAEGKLDAVNARLKLVAQLKRYKESRGIGFVDPEREEWMVNYLLRANRGPLSDEGLRELYVEVLDLTKREVARGDEG